MRLPVLFCAFLGIHVVSCLPSICRMVGKSRRQRAWELALGHGFNYPFTSWTTKVCAHFVNHESNAVSQANGLPLLEETGLMEWNGHRLVAMLLFLSVSLFVPFFLSRTVGASACRVLMPPVSLLLGAEPKVAMYLKSISVTLIGSTCGNTSVSCSSLSVSTTGFAPPSTLSHSIV